MADLFTTGKWYHYARLPRHQQLLYMQIYNGLKSGKTDFSFPVEAHNGVYPTRDRIVDLFLHVIWDNPELYYVDATNTDIAYTPKAYGKARISYRNYFPVAQRPQVEQALRLRVDEILEDLHGRPEGYSRLHRLYRYMVENIQYMHDVNRDNTLKNLEARTVVGPLLSHLGVCAGYTKAFKLLCDQLGIGCFYIRGQGLGEKGWGNHGWNVVYLDGAFYHVDLTFESNHYHSDGKHRCQYFLRSDAAMEKDHRWDRSAFPIMANDYL